MKSLAQYGTLMLIGVMGGIKAEINLAMMMINRLDVARIHFEKTPNLQMLWKVITTTTTTTTTIDEDDRPRTGDDVDR